MENSEIKVLVLMKGNVGEEVIKLKEGLSKAFEKDVPEKEASVYPNLTNNDEFDTDTETTLRAWQSGVGLVADGIAGPRTFSALGIWEPPKLAVRVDTALVAKLFPFSAKEISVLCRIFHNCSARSTARSLFPGIAHHHRDSCYPGIFQV